MGAPMMSLAGTGAGLSKLSGSLGLGKQGEYYQPTDMNNQGLDALNFSAKGYTDQGQNKAVDAYSTSDQSLADALKASQGSSTFKDMLAMDPVAAQKMATEQVQGNPILGQLFGKGGAMERANTEEQELASRGYSLKPEDYEAYGQASGDIARMFGQQEQNLAQSLADRGLSSSGAAGAGFTGLQGNKNEQLAGMQRQIADNRMKMNLERLGQTRNYLSGLGQQGQSAIFGTRDRNLEGVQAKQGLFNNAANAANSAWQGQQAANQASMLNKQKQKAPTLGESLGMGISSAAQKAPEAGMTAAMA